jgi:hypothetical protein
VQGSDFNPLVPLTRKKEGRDGGRGRERERKKTKTQPTEWRKYLQTIYLMRDCVQNAENS